MNFHQAIHAIVGRVSWPDQETEKAVRDAIADEHLAVYGQQLPGTEALEGDAPEAPTPGG